MSWDIKMHTTSFFQNRNIVKNINNMHGQMYLFTWNLVLSFVLLCQLNNISRLCFSCLNSCFTFCWNKIHKVLKQSLVTVVRGSLSLIVLTQMSWSRVSRLYCMRLICWDHTASWPGLHYLYRDICYPPLSHTMTIFS